MILTDVVTVKDKKHHASTKFTKQNDIFYIKFKDKLIPFKNNNKGVDLFNKKEEHQEITCQYVADKINVNLVVPKTLTIYMLKLIICDILKIHYSSLYLDNIKDVLNVNEEFYDNQTIIGDSQNLTFVVDEKNPTRNNMYDKIYMPEIQIHLSKIRTISNDVETPYIYNLKYLLYIPKMKINVDLCKLFNINKTSTTFSKIFIHTDVLNKYENNTNSYIKSSYPSPRPFMDVDEYRNSVIFIYNKPINNDAFIVLHQIIICQNGCFIFSFKNIYQMFSYDELNDIISTWMKKSAINILKQTYLNECIYDINFEYEKLIYNNMSIDGIVNINIKTKITNLDKINDIPNMTKIYKTKSSVRSYLLQDVSVSSAMLSNVLDNTNTNLSTTSIMFYYAPILQINVIDKTMLKISLTNVSTFEHFNFLFNLITQNIEYNATKTLKHKNDTNEIINNARELDDKIKIKILKDTDPLTFGSRYVETNNGNILRDYSQLVQHNEQRPVLITSSEYNKLNKNIPDSLLNIENQTTHERMFLLCPFKEFPIINYHHFNKQKCIIKCTTKFSNQTQFTYCDADLNGKGNDKTQKNKFTSNTITSFNPIIGDKRKCLPPEELYDILSNYILEKVMNNYPNEDVSVVSPNTHAFIIERDDINNVYIIQTEYNEKNEPYTLMLTNKNQDGYFIFRDLLTNEILTFTKEHKNNFIKQLITTSKYQQPITSLIDVYNKLTKKKINNTLSLKEFSEITHKDTIFITDIKSTFIIGFLFHKTIYLCTHIFNTGVKNMLPANLTIKNTKLKLPNYNDLNVEDIEKLYKDYETKLIVGVKIYNTNLPITPYKVMDKRVRYEYVDGYTFKLDKITLSKTPINKQHIKHNLVDFNNFVIELLYLCYMKRYNIKDVIKYFQSKKRELVYLNDEILSWRLSKLSSEDANEILKKTSFDDIMVYERILKNLTLKYNEQNEYLYSGGIY